MQHPHTTALLTLCCALPLTALGAAPQCKASSGSTLTPVIELYTSEGCSSCPPADQWLSGLKGQPVVAQAFHVAYWDYIGWKDRFAQPVFSARQKEIALHNHLRNIYTPQLVQDGRDWAHWRSAQGQPLALPRPAAQARISLQRVAAATALRPGWSRWMRKPVDRLLERDRRRPQLARQGRRKRR